MDIIYKAGFVGNEHRREIALTVTDGSAPNQVITVEFGTLTTQKDDEPAKVAGRWAVTRTIYKDGEAKPHTTYGTDITKMVDNVIAIAYGNVGVLPDQVVHDADFEDEFYAQKHEQVTDNVWRMPEYADKVDAFTEMRGSLEELFEQAQESGANTQGDYLKASQMLLSMKEAVGGNMKLLESIIRGEGDANANMPVLSKLGKGVNALREAMVLAELSEGEFTILPVNQTSGKGITSHRAKAVAMVTEKAYSSKAPRIEFADFTINDKGDKGSLPTRESIGAIVRVIANRFFGVVEALEMSDGEYTTSLGDVAAMVNSVALERCVDYRNKYGKHVNMYDSDEAKAALAAYGAVQCSDAATLNLFADAVERIEKALESAEDTITYGLLINSAIGTRGNLMLRHAVNVCKSAVDANAKTAEITDALEEADDVENVTAVGFAGLGSLAAAAHLYKLLNTHPNAGDVWAEMKGLCSAAAPANQDKQRAA